MRLFGQFDYLIFIFIYFLTTSSRSCKNQEFDETWVRSSLETPSHSESDRTRLLFIDSFLTCACWETQTGFWKTRKRCSFEAGWACLPPARVTFHPLIICLSSSLACLLLCISADSLSPRRASGISSALLRACYFAFFAARSAQRLGRQCKSKKRKRGDDKLMKPHSRVCMPSSRQSNTSARKREVLVLRMHGNISAIMQSKMRAIPLASLDDMLSTRVQDNMHAREMRSGWILLTRRC